jgi:tetratricopeptide (TPR) repeat protein
MGPTVQFRRELQFVILLCLLVLAAYWPLSYSEFIHYDDGQYVFSNPHVNTGLSWPNIQWAFQAGYANNWHPLTWLSHMLDVQLFGLKPGAHHLVNLFWHIANTVLVFLVLRRLTTVFWPSALVAALFGLHPLHVESVAWVSERKDMLSTFFFLLTLWSYWRYAESIRAQQETIGENSLPSRAQLDAQGSATPLPVKAHRPLFFYLLALFLFALGLMCKPMLVSLPFVLLLLDYWPLARLQLEWPKFLTRFMLPAPDSAKAAPPTPVARLLGEKVPFFVLALGVCIVTYKVQTPSNTLAVPLSSRLHNAVAAFVQYLAQTFWPSRMAVFYPHPDLRYPVTHQLSHFWPAWALCGSVLGLTAFTIGALVCFKRTPWLAVGWLWFLGTLIPVIGLVQVGLQASADRYTYIPHIGLFICIVWGAALAFDRLRVVPALRAGVAVLTVLVCLALTRHQVGYWRDNMTLFEHALAVTENNSMAHFHVGTGLGAQGQFQAAAAHFRAAIEADPSYSTPYFSLGLILAAQGKPQEALTNFWQASRLSPESAPVLTHLAWFLATYPQANVRDGAEALRLAQKACALTGGKVPQCLAALDAAYAELGRFPEAIRTAEEGRDEALAAGQKDLAKAAENRLDSYRNHRPYREEP